MGPRLSPCRSAASRSRGQPTTGDEHEPVVRDIFIAISSDISSPVGLLLKAIQALPKAEQAAVLGYLLDRGSGVPGAALAGVGLAGQSPVPSSLPDWHHIRAAHILRRISDGAGTAEIAGEVGVEPEELRLALRDVARRSGESKRAELFTALAEGATVDEAARKLRMTKGALASELSPSKNLVSAVAATLMGRTQLPSVAEGLPRGPLKTIPVRLPEQQYERLKRWCEANDFPMAVVVRGLVEHFLDQQERRAT